MRILVTGGAGFIGSHIVDALIAGGHEAAVVDNLSSGKRENIHALADLYQTDITDYVSLASIFALLRPDVICHQAAQPSLRRSIDDPAFDASVNIVGTLNLIALAKRYAVNHFVMASTSAVYDPTGMLPYAEDDDLAPDLPYGIAKFAAEMYLRRSGLSHTILRYGNVYGPRQIPVGENQLMPHCLNYLLHGAPFVVNGDGEQTRDFVYVGDIARANVLALEKMPQGIFNAGTGKSASVNYVVGQLLLLSNNVDWLSYGPAKPGEARYVTLDSRKAEREMDWRAEIALADGLRLTYEWARKQ